MNLFGIDINPSDRLGNKMKYFVGNKRAGMGSAEDSCEIEFLIGPTYTSPNFVKSTKLRIFYNDKIITASDFDTKKVKNSNCYVGELNRNDIKVQVTDFSLWGTKEFIRSFAISNKTVEEIEIRLEFTVETDLKIIQDKDRQLICSTDGESKLFCWTEMTMTDWLSRAMEIYFTSEFETSVIDSDEESNDKRDRMYLTSTIRVKPFSCEETALVFAFGESMNEETRHIGIKEVRDQFRKNIQNWEEWTAKLKIGHIPEGTEKDIVISSLVMIKACQSYDGGFMACPFQYCFSYFRDSFGALTGLYKAGCAEELKDFLLWADNVYRDINENFNSCAMGGTLLQNLDSSSENLASESPSYFCLIAKYYYNLTRDEKFIRQIMPSLDIAINSQLDYIEKNNGHLRFNGDETEQYVPRKDGDMYYFTPDFNRNDYSVASLLLFLAAAEFYTLFENSERLAGAITHVNAVIKWQYADCDGILCWQRGPVSRNYLITNYNMFPVWLDVELPDGLSAKNTAGILKYINPTTGFLPISPGVVEGFTGHTMGILLSNLNKMNHPYKERVLAKLTGLCDSYGTFSEFYGPGGISNTHNMNIFSSGINVAAIIEYFKQS